MLICYPDYTGAAEGQIACFTFSGTEQAGFAYATTTLDPPSIAYTNQLGNDVTLAWS